MKTLMTYAVVALCILPESANAQNEVRDFPTAISKMEDMVFKNQPIDFNEIKQILQFVDSSLPEYAPAPKSAAPGPEGSGCWEKRICKRWQCVCSRNGKRCRWKKVRVCEWVYVPSECCPAPKAYAAPALSKLKLKIKILRAGLSNVEKQTDTEILNDYVRQVYAVLLTADDSDPGHILRRKNN